MEIGRGSEQKLLACGRFKRKMNCNELGSLILIGSKAKDLCGTKSPVLDQSYASMYWALYSSQLPPKGLQYSEFVEDMAIPDAGTHLILKQKP